MRALLLLILFFPVNEAHSYVRTISEAGLPLHWISPSQAFKANPRNSSGLTEQEVAETLGPAFSAWSVPGTSAHAHYSQSLSYPTNSNYDGVNAVYFSSAAGRSMDFGVVAITEVLYYVSSGRIAETDIVFNDNHFRFTANEGDTGKFIGGKMAVYLRDVATHEAGHAFGIDHSTVNLSSLVYTAFSGQFTLSDDDKNAIRSIYPAGGARGALTGDVRGRNGGIFGAHVAAVNLDTGRVEAGTLSGPSGGFRVGDIPPGRYAVLMEPFGADITSVSTYFQNVNHRFCTPSQRFRRRFYGPCGTSQVSVVEVQNGASTSLGTLSPSCIQMGNPEGAPISLQSAAELPAAGGARFGTIRPGETHYYKVQGASGHLLARALAYALYSPVDLHVEILDSEGEPLNGSSSVDNVQDPMPGGYVNYDSLAEAEVVPGDYIVRVQAAARRLSSNLFPAGFDLLDGDGHYLLALAADGEFGQPATSDMSACVSVNNVVQNAHARLPASNRERDQVTGCGSLGSTGGPPWSGGLLQLLFALALIHLSLAVRGTLVPKRP
jgi:hypothetical protein